VNLELSPLPSSLLAPLSEIEAERVQRETDETLVKLLREGRLAANTRRSYRSALRYWSAWHLAAFGRPLALSATPPVAVVPDVVRAFIAHHAPKVTEAGKIVPSMPETVRIRLSELVSIQRQVCRRDDASNDAPTMATLRHRVSTLNAMHGLLGLPGPLGVDPTLQGLLRAAQNVASAVAPATLRLPKREITRELLEVLLGHCDADDSPEGLRDGALLAVGFFGGGRRRSELASMRWSDLAPFEDRVRSIAGWLWEIPAVKGKRRERADQGAMRTLILEDAAHRLDRWRDWCAASDDGPQGSVWRRVRRLRAGWAVSAAMDAEDIAARVKARISQAGLNPDHYAAHSLRSGAVTTLLLEGADLATAAQMVGHASLETTRRHYDRRTLPVDGLVRLSRKHLT